MHLTDYIMDLMATCPHIRGELSDCQRGYTVGGRIATAVLKRYLNGDTQRQCTFTLTSHEPKWDNKDKMCHAGNWEAISQWMDQATRGRSLPSMGEGLQPLRLEIVDSNHLPEMAGENKSEPHMIQCRFTYYEKARNNECY